MQGQWPFMVPSEPQGSAVGIKSGNSNMVPLCHAYTTATTNVFPFCLLPLQTVDLLWVLKGFQIPKWMFQLQLYTWCLFHQLEHHSEGLQCHMAFLLVYQMLQSGGVQRLRPTAAAAHCKAILAQQPHLLCADNNKNSESEDISSYDTLIFLTNYIHRFLNATENKLFILSVYFPVWFMTPYQLHSLQSWMEA